MDPLSVSHIMSLASILFNYIKLTQATMYLEMLVSFSLIIYFLPSSLYDPRMSDI